MASKQKMDDRKTRGVCVRCGKMPAKPRHTQCSLCLKRTAESTSRYYRKKIGGSEILANTRLDQQGFCCAICGQPDGVGTRTSRRLALDHCHHTDQLRGMLCDGCNMGLGYFKDNLPNLLAAAVYLRKYRSPLIPSV
jgi:hypothetical protein